MRRRFAAVSLAVLALALPVAPAPAADPPRAAVAPPTASPAASAPVFPPGASVGLVPPPGMVPAAAFAGFQDPAGGASIVVTSLPAEAYPALSGIPDEAWTRRQGIRIAGRQDWPLPGAQAVLLRGTQEAGGLRVRKWVLVAGTPETTALVTVQVPEASSAYPDPVIEAALSSVALRAAPGLEEQVAALPFTVRERAGFRVSRTLSGTGLILTEGPLDTVPDAEQPVVVVAFSALPVPDTPERRDALARRTLSGVAGLRDVSMERFETPARTGGPLYVAEATAEDARSGGGRYLVQTLRFVPGGALHAVGIARAESRAALAPRLRAIAGSVEPRR